DVESLEPAEAAERIKARTIRLELALALDAWASLSRGNNKPGDVRWKRLLVVARAVDSDPWRNQLRDAWEYRRAAALNQSAGSAETSNLPLQSWFLFSVHNSGLDREHELSVLRQAQRIFPNDYWFNFKLAWALDFASPAYQDFGEAVRFYTAA